MIVYDNVRLPTDVEQGAQGGPQWYTSVVTMASGRESRNQNWSAPKCLWDIGYGIQTKADFAAILAFFYARRGRLRAFLFKDWTDYEGVQEAIGVGDGTNKVFQLVRNYTDDIAPYVRTIVAPVYGTVAVYVDGTTSVDVTSGANGTVTFGTAPASGAVITASFQFDVPVRFDDDKLALQATLFNAAAIPSINIVEVVA